MPLCWRPRRLQVWTALSRVIRRAMLAERGEGLSGGQRQSIALARAVIDNPPILLLDEPTSAMDVQTETDVVARLKAALGGSTLVLITHRPSLLELVDRVIVIEQGAVVLDGPKALLRQPVAVEAVRHAGE